MKEGRDQEQLDQVVPQEWLAKVQQWINQQFNHQVVMMTNTGYPLSYGISRK